MKIKQELEQPNMQNTKFQQNVRRKKKNTPKRSGEMNEKNVINKWIWNRKMKKKTSGKV